MEVYTTASALKNNFVWGAVCHDLTQSVICAGLLYCMEFLEHNMDWLQEKMEPLMEG